MKALNILLALVVSVLIGAAVLEGGLRLLGMGPADTLNQFDPVLGWSKKPDYRLGKSTGEFDVTFQTNELGLRDDPMGDPRKPANTFRVLMLGDSFTLGWAVDREDLFVDQLERWWQRENRRVDVINVGTEGYSTDQSVAWLMERGRDFEPDLVLLFPYDNDLYWNGQTDYVGKGKPRFTPDGGLESRELVDTTEKTWSENLAVRKLVSKLAGSSKDHSEHNFKPGSVEIPREFGALLLDRPGFMAEAEAHTLGAFKAFKATCDRLGARGIVVPIPSHGLVDAQYARKLGGFLGLADDQWDPNRPFDTNVRFAQQAGLETLDARTTLKATSSGKQLYNKVDWHFNPAGNLAFAHFLHDQLDHIGAFPEGHAKPKGAPVPLPKASSRAVGPPFWLELYAVLWVVLTILYLLHYKDEPKWQPPLKVAAMLSAVFAIVMGGNALVGMLPARAGSVLAVIFVLGVLGFVLYKIGRRLATIAELLKSFVLRGHWYLMPLIVVLLTIGSLLVVAASSPLVAPFIYTLF